MIRVLLAWTPLLGLLTLLALAALIRFAPQ